MLDGSPSFPGYDVTGVAGEDCELVIYRGTRKHDHRPVLIKAILDSHVAPALFEALEHELELADRLDASFALHPIALERFAAGAALILDDAPGAPLGHPSKPLDVADFLATAQAIAAAFEGLSKAQLVHKAITPEHIWLDRASGGIKLTGFGIASLAQRELAAPYGAVLIKGSLPYMSPEQTGRTNRAVDFRSDYYALGVMLYELLTGTLPFFGRDPAEWVHSHLAVTPSRPEAKNPRIPAGLSDVVMKLLSKTPEARYQSAAGLLADLARCAREWSAGGRIDRFKLGEHDVSDRFLIPQKLYGREREVEALHAAFGRVAARGTPELVLIAGFSGIGKTALVRELIAPIVAARGLFGAGKADQYVGARPYSGFALAIRELIRPIIGASERSVAGYRTALQDALGLNAGLVVELVPELEGILGAQPPLPDLSPTDAQNRCHRAFRLLFSVLAGPDHPVTLFIDDLQWMDPASLALIRDLISHPDTRYLLLIGAYRDNEVGPLHPLVLALAEIQKAHVRVETLTLAALGLRHLGQLIADTFACPPSDAEPLAVLIESRTAGNPLFAIRFLTALHRDGLIQFDRQAGLWRWDLAQIRAQSHGDNVVDLMIARLRRLSGGAVQALKLAACIGVRAEVQTLADIAGRSLSELQKDLAAPVQEELIMREDGAIRFLHDRIQQASYALIEERDRPAMHLQIGRSLLERTPNKDFEPRVFELVDQLNRARSLIDNEEERSRVASLDLVAGRRAKAAAAYHAAADYLSAGLSLLGGDPFEAAGVPHALAFELCLERAECEWLRGDPSESERLLSALYPRAADRTERAIVHRSRIRIYGARAASEAALEEAFACLKSFDIELDRHPSEARISVADRELEALLAAHSTESLIELPVLRDPGLVAVLDVLVEMLPSAYFTDTGLHRLVAAQVVCLTLEHGVAPASAMGFAAYAFELSSEPRTHAEGERLARVARSLIDRHRYLGHKAKVYLLLGAAIGVWARPLEECSADLAESFRAAIETGDLVFGCYIAQQRVILRLYAGNPLREIEDEADRAIEFIRAVGSGPLIEVVRIHRQLVRALQGRTEGLLSFVEADFDMPGFEASAKQFPTALLYFELHRLQACLLAEDFAEARDAGARAEALVGSLKGQLAVAELVFCRAIAEAAQLGAPEVLDALRGYSDRLRGWSAHGTSTFFHMYALISAELARHEGRTTEAARLYEDGIRSARENGFVHHEAIGNELVARMYHDLGIETAAVAYLRGARWAYLRWGAEAKVRELDRRHPEIREPGSSGPAQLTAGELDMLAAIKASQAISSEIHLFRLQEMLLGFMLEEAGAQRGSLFIVREGELRMAAEARITEQGITIRREDAAPDRDSVPLTIVNYVRRTGDTVLIEDARTRHAFAADPYFLDRRPRTVLCLPIIRQTTPTAVLYVENDLAEGMVTPAQLATLELLAAQAAISLENARLHADRERALKELRDLNVELERRVRERTVELEAANKELVAFTHAASHDLSAPLRHIEGFSGALLTDGGADRLEPEHRGYLERIRAGARRMRELVEDLMRLSNMTNAELRRETVDLRAMARSIAADLLRQNPERQVTFTIADSLVARGDARLLRIALENLLSNAWKYTAKRETSRIELGKIEQEGGPVFFVRDNGAGFDMRSLERLFQPFQRLHRSDEFEGTGIGLATVERIVRRHGGRIWAEAGVDRGATFFFTL